MTFPDPVRLKPDTTFNPAEAGHYKLFDDYQVTHFEDHASRLRRVLHVQPRPLHVADT